MKSWFLLLLLTSSQAQLLRPALTTTLNRPTNNNELLADTAPKDYDYPFYFITMDQLTNRSPGIVLEDSSELGPRLSSLQLSHWFEFELEGFPSIGSERDPFYEMQVRYASPSGGGAFLLYHVTEDEMGAEELVLVANVTDFNATESWQRYETKMVTSRLPLPSLFQDRDTVRLRGVVRQVGFNLQWFYLIAGNIRDTPGMTNTNPRRPPPNPPNRGRLSFFHKFITVDDFVAGSDDVIVEENTAEGRRNFGQLNVTSWMQFPLTVPVTGLYNIHVRLASPDGDGSFDLMRVREAASSSSSSSSMVRTTTLSLQAVPASLKRPVATATAPLPGTTSSVQGPTTTTPLLPPTDITSTIPPPTSSLEWIASFEEFPATGAWNQYTRITPEEVLLEGGEHLYSINVTAPGFNWLWLYVEPSDLLEAIGARGDGLL